MLMASPNEGGPIILIEAWGQRKPFFMRRTGLAAEHPHSVFMIGTLRLKRVNVYTSWSNPPQPVNAHIPALRLSLLSRCADEKETADVTAAAVNSVATKVLAGDESVMRVLKNGYESYEKYHSEETIVPKWQAVINSAYLGLLQNDEAGLYYPKLNIRAVHDFHGNPSHIRVTSIGRTRLLQNLNTDYNSLSLAEMDITYILKQMYNAKRAHISGTVASQPQGPGAVAAAAAAKAVAAAAPHNTPQSADRMGDPSQVLQMQPVRAVLQVEYETVSDGLPIQRDGSTGSHKVSAGFLDVRVRRKTSGLGTSEATVGPGGQNPTDDLQLSIRLEAEALNRVKTLLMPPVGFEYLSILFRIRGGMTINVLGVSIKSSSDF